MGKFNFSIWLKILTSSDRIHVDKIEGWERLDFISKWLIALTVVPRVDKEEWDRLDFVSKWLIATRSVVLIMTFLSSAIGGLLAYKMGKFQFLPWLLCALGLVLAHATNNLLNDLIDHLQGVDRDNYFRVQYGPQPLENGLMSFKTHFLYIFFTGLVAFIIGVYLVYLRFPIALYLFLAGSFFLLFYTFPLKYIGMGELAVLIVWGPLMVGGSYYISSGEWSWKVVVASLPYALGVTSVLLGKHIDKYEFDKARGIRTLPVILGERNARILTIIVMLSQYLLVLYLVAVRFFSPILLLVFLVFPSFLYVFRMFKEKKPKEMPEGYREDVWPLWFVAGAFWHNRRFGIAYLIALIIDVIFAKAGF
jgi:1,4-dihydroxy-2-naphthoate octaprenyltransferase